jgi:hypothetical protein
MLGVVRVRVVGERVVRTLAFSAGFVDGVLGLVFLHGVGDDRAI